MQKLSMNEMINITAGGLSAGVMAAIAAGIAFLAGLVDGYTRPYKCR